MLSLRRGLLLFETMALREKQLAAVQRTKNRCVAADGQFRTGTRKSRQSNHGGRSAQGGRFGSRFDDMSIVICMMLSDYPYTIFFDSMKCYSGA